MAQLTEEQIEKALKLLKPRVVPVDPDIAEIQRLRREEHDRIVIEAKRRGINLDDPEL